MTSSDWKSELLSASLIQESLMDRYRERKFTCIEKSNVLSLSFFFLSTRNSRLLLAKLKRLVFIKFPKYIPTHNKTFNKTRFAS